MDVRTPAQRYATSSDGPFGRDQRKKAEALRLVMWFFLAALTMFFGGTVVAYMIIRITGKNAPPLGALHLPQGLYLSTLLLVASSWTIHNALVAVRCERQSEFRRAMLWTAALGGGFLVVQTIGLVQLLIDHQHFRTQNVHLYGLVWAIVLVHAAHVVGGLIPLGIVTRRSFQGAYDHEWHEGVVLFSRYWHFLDVVWLAMLAMFLGLR